MRLVILDTSSDVSEWAAKYIRRKIHDFKPGPDRYFTLGLPTGMSNFNKLDPLSAISCHGDITPRPRIEPATRGLQIGCFTY